MTAPLLARLFVVPAMIVALIVVCAVVVILLFGSITAEKDRSLEDLVRALESATGQPNFFGGYWAKDKDYYHAERELLLRLRNKEVPAEQRPHLARRLAAVLERVMSAPADERTLTNERCLMLALGYLEQPAGLEVLLSGLAGGTGEVWGAAATTRRRQYAAEALALLENVAEARRAVVPLARVVGSGGEVKELRMVVSVALSRLAPPGNAAAVDALKAAYYTDDRELKWNAALGLARLGDATAVSLLKEMLSRDYWEGQKRLAGGGPQEANGRYKLTPVEVGGYLAATIEATADLGVPELDELIGKLKDDPWPAVREKVRWATGRVVPQAESADSKTSG